jgi:hypothetical protein
MKSIDDPQSKGFPPCPPSGPFGEGMPVQFFPAYNPLLEEALAEARETR